jgi:hypothetical protein
MKGCNTVGMDPEKILQLLCCRKFEAGLLAGIMRCLLPTVSNDTKSAAFSETLHVSA